MIQLLGFRNFIAKLDSATNAQANLARHAAQPKAAVECLAAAMPSFYPCRVTDPQVSGKAWGLDMILANVQYGMLLGRELKHLPRGDSSISSGDVDQVGQTIRSHSDQLVARLGQDIYKDHLKSWPQ